MTPILSTTGGGSVRGFGRRRPVPSGPSGPSGQPSAVSATAVGTVNDASNGRLNLVWTNGDAAAQTRIYNGGTLLATENAGTTTKSLTTLNANTAYTLTVKHFKDSIESAGANFSQATTYQYNGSVNSTSCAGDNNLDLYSNVANGNGGTSSQLTTAGSYTCVTNYNISATGGTTSDANGWRTHEFNSSDTFAISSCDSGAVVQVILAAGGGGSSTSVYRWGQGGGGGGSLEYNYATGVSAGNYSITIGAGGAPGTTYSGNKGANTTGFGTTAYGGGRGGSMQHAPNSGGSSGGQSGYGGNYPPGDPDFVTNAIDAGSGNNVNAGGGNYGDRVAGGGGGAGGAGQFANVNTSEHGGNGGSALAIGFSPYNLCGGGGGGAGWDYDTWIGGTGGSGAGNGASVTNEGPGANEGVTLTESTNGTANRGGGAGGPNYQQYGGGGNAVYSGLASSGGSGIALIRYRIS